MRNIFLITILIIAALATAEAQQIHQLSNYILNDFAFNPAVAGKNPDDLVLKGTFRKQWAGGFNGDEPTTFMFSAHSNMNQKKTVGLGMMLYSDKTGPTERLGAQLAYSYHIPLEDTKRNFLALGISANIISYTLNFDKIDVLEVSDPTILMNNENKTTFDANFGAYLHGPDYWLGVSAMQLIQSRLDLGGQTLTGEELGVSLATHFYGSAGYKIDAGENLDLIPSVMVKIVQNVPLHYELNLRAMYQEQYWVGVGYRAEDAISLMLGADLAKGFNFAYSYDLISSAINDVSSGSHEIVIGYDYKWQKGPMKAKPFKYKETHL